MLIHNLYTGRGNIANNQIVLEHDGEIVFISYDAPIAKYSEVTGELVVSDSWSYSNTTTKYFKQFINNFTDFTYNNKAEFENLIVDGEKITQIEAFAISANEI